MRWGTLVGLGVLASTIGGCECRGNGALATSSDEVTRTTRPAAESSPPNRTDTRREASETRDDPKSDGGPNTKRGSDDASADPGGTVRPRRGDTRGLDRTDRRDAGGPESNSDAASERSASFDASQLHKAWVDDEDRVAFDVPVAPERTIDLEVAGHDVWSAPYRPDDWPEPYDAMTTVDVLTPEGPDRLEIVKVLRERGRRGRGTRHSFRTESIEVDMTELDGNTLVAPGGTMADEATIELVDSDGGNLPDYWRSVAQSDRTDSPDTLDPRLVADPDGDGTFGVMYREPVMTHPVFYRWVDRKADGGFSVRTLVVYD